MEFNLITDRTPDDVAEAKRIISKYQRGEELTESELEKFYTGLKGSYNISDLNRVGRVLQYLNDQLNSQRYPVDISPRSDWRHDEILKQSDWYKYLQDVRKIRSAFTLPATTPEAPETLFAINNYKFANDIEKILFDLERYFQNMVDNYSQVGELYLGED